MEPELPPVSPTYILLWILAYLGSIGTIVAVATALIVMAIEARFWRALVVTTTVSFAITTTIFALVGYLRLNELSELALYVVHLLGQSAGAFVFVWYGRSLMRRIKKACGRE